MPRPDGRRLLVQRALRFGALLDFAGSDFGASAEVAPFSTFGFAPAPFG